MLQFELHKHYSFRDLPEAVQKEVLRKMEQFHETRSPEQAEVIYVGIQDWRFGGVNSVLFMFNFEGDFCGHTSFTLKVPKEEWPCIH